MDIDTSDFAVTRIGGEQIPLTRDFVENIAIISKIEGKCMADPSLHFEVTQSKFLRDRKFYLKNVLAPLIASGKVSDGTSGPYDDRKLRFDSAGSTRFDLNAHLSESHGSRDVLRLAFGITYFGEHKKAMDRSPEENNSLRRKGLEDFGDQYAYFPRAPGASGLVISSEGSVFLGTRNYRGREMLQTVAGHLPYKENVEDISLEEGVFEETREEFGIPKEDIARTVFVGAYEEPHSGDIDFTHLLFTKLDNSQVREAWRTQREDEEHKRLIEIPSYAQVKSLLDDGSVRGETIKYGLFQPTRGALMSLRQEEISD